VRNTAKFVLTLLVGIAIGAWGVPALRAQTAGHPAYVVAEVQVTNPAGFTAYAKQVPASLAPYHGRTLARALPDVREGPPPNGDIVIIAFNSPQDANHWYASPEYSKLIPLRQQSAITRVMIVDGLPQ
jgi:uncharacterized protein (DUF1330 family)